MRYLTAVMGLILPMTALADDPLIPRHVLFGNPDKAAPQISPDGKYLAFLAPVDGVLNVWVGPSDDPSRAKPVTADKGRGIRSYNWAYTNAHIMYVQDTGGDEDFHIYVVETAKGPESTKDLTPGKKIRAEIQEVSQRFPDEILVALNDRDARYHDIHLLNIRTGKKKLIEKNTQFAGFMTDEDFKVRYASKQGADGGLIAFVPDGKGGWKEFEKVPFEDTLTSRALFFDKSGGMYAIDSRGRNTGVVVRRDTKTGEQKVIAEHPRADAGTVLRSPVDFKVQAVSFNYDRPEWVFIDKAVAADFSVLRKVAKDEPKIADPDCDLHIVSRTKDDTTWIIGFVIDNGPVRYYRYDRAEKKATFLFTNQKDLEGLPLKKMTPTIIKSRDGLDLVCYLTRADDASLQPAPMVLLVHGGPWSRDTWGLNPLHQWLANRGYNVLSVNYRGSTGFGKTFVNAGNREWAGKMHDDLIDAVDWAIQSKHAIPDKVAIMGGSYGGYATLVGLTFTPDKFACGVDIVGPSNITTLLKTIPPYWFPMIEQFKKRVGDPTTEDGITFLNSRSPLSKVDQIRKPLLIGQGANDPRVKQSESDQIVEAMTTKKIPVTYVLFPDEGHGFARPENRMAFYSIAEAFLAKHLGGKAEPFGSAFTKSSVLVPTGADRIEGLKSNLPKK